MNRKNRGAYLVSVLGGVPTAVKELVSSAHAAALLGIASREAGSARSKKLPSANESTGKNRKEKNDEEMDPNRMP